MQRSLKAPMLVALSVVAVACASGAPPADTAIVTPEVAGVERLLELSGLESIVSSRAPAFTRQVALLAADLSDAELERLVPAVTAEFAAARLTEDVAAFISSEDERGFVPEISSWYEGGANGELIALTEVYEPPLTLEEFVRGMVEAPPDQERVRVLAEWAEAQGAGDFFVILEEALSEAAHAVWGELRSDAPPFEAMSGWPLFERLDQSSSVAVVRFMHRHETVPSSVIQAATEEYRTEAGRWYVETYSLAVAEAIRAAGKRVVAALRTSGS